MKTEGDIKARLKYLYELMNEKNIGSKRGIEARINMLLWVLDNEEDQNEGI